jgi:hypothetical protein
VNLDSRVITAIKEAVAEAGETTALAQKMIVWLEGLAGGNARLSDRDLTARHLDLLYQAVREAEDDQLEL